MNAVDFYKELTLASAVCAVMYLRFIVAAFWQFFETNDSLIEAQMISRLIGGMAIYGPLAVVFIASQIWLMRNVNFTRVWSLVGSASIVILALSLVANLLVFL